MKVVMAGALYWALVFGVGFILGPIRILWAAPRFGARTAELMEAPIMLIVITVAARWIVRRLAVPPAAAGRLGIGFLALGLLLFAEFTLGLWIRGISLEEYLAGRDPVAGAVYCGMLGVFAVMPYLVDGRGILERRTHHEGRQP